MDLKHRDRALGVARGDPDRARYRSDRGDTLRELAAETVAQDRAVRHAGREHTTTIGAELRLQMIEERGDERDVVDGVLYRAPTA